MFLTVKFKLQEFTVNSTVIAYFLKYGFILSILFYGISPFKDIF